MQKQKVIENKLTINISSRNRKGKSKMKLSKKENGVYSAKVESFKKFYELKCILQCNQENNKDLKIKEFLPKDIGCNNVSPQHYGEELRIGLVLKYEKIKAYAPLSINMKTGEVIIELNLIGYHIAKLNDVKEIKDLNLKKAITNQIKNREYFSEKKYTRGVYYIIHRHNDILSVLIDKFIPKIELLLEKLSKAKTENICKKCTYIIEYKKNKECFKCFVAKNIMKIDPK